LTNRSTQPQPQVMQHVSEQHCWRSGLVSWW